MLEIPESRVISVQADRKLFHKKIARVLPATNPHKFAFFSGDPATYEDVLRGKQVLSAHGHGMFVDLHCGDRTCITLSEGTHITWHGPSEQPPAKYQLLIRFDDDSSLVFTVAMYGGIWLHRENLDNPYYQGSLNSVSPLEEAFNASYFDAIVANTSRDLSLKALLATEQRIPGLGNGVLQDILFRASLHPRRKKSTLTEVQKAELFRSLKETLHQMTAEGGRDTEKDLFGNPGGYRTLLSKNTLDTPCPRCGTLIMKEAYLGGAVYFCPRCQPW